MKLRIVGLVIAGFLCAGLALALISCMPIPVPSGTESHHVYEQESLEELEGSTREAIETRFGMPDKKFGNSQRRYLVYRGGVIQEYDYVPVVVPIQLWIPFLAIAAASDDEASAEARDPYSGDTFCYLFELDRKDILRRVEVKKGPDLDCELAFFTAAELSAYEAKRKDLRLEVVQDGNVEAIENLVIWFGDDDVDELKKEHLKSRFEAGDDSYELKLQLAGLGFSDPLAELGQSGDLQASIDLLRISGNWRPLKRLADNGDAVAAKMLKMHSKTSGRMIGGLSPYEIFELAEKGDANAQLQLYYAHDADDRHIWLCRAADNGQPEARYRLANLYEFGSEGFPQDNAMAQVWYRFAAYTGHVWGNRNAERLAETSSLSDLGRARILEQEWQPGQCEIELSQD